MTTLLQYLAALATDPAAQQAFAHDPEAALAGSDLSEADRAVLRTRNNGLIQATVGAQAVASMIYSTAPGPQIIYAPAPPPAPPAAMIYAIVIPVTCGAHPAAPAPAMIYAPAPAPHPAMIYAPHAQPAMIYAPHAQPAMIYAPHAQPAMIYGEPPAPAPAPAAPPATPPGTPTK